MEMKNATVIIAMLFHTVKRENLKIYINLILVLKNQLTKY